jgi:hypothetical protein
VFTTKKKKKKKKKKRHNRSDVVFGDKFLTVGLALGPAMFYCNEEKRTKFILIGQSDRNGNSY